MNRGKMAIGFILYHPGNAALERISWLLDMGYPLYICDNSPSLQQGIGAIKCLENRRYFTTGGNAGIGRSFQLMCATAFYEGYSHLLYFDQDTVFTQDTLKFIQRVLDSRIYDLGLNHALSMTFRDKVDRRDTLGEIKVLGQRACYVPFTISSGTLFSLNALKILGWHDPTFFVDGVDYSICLSAAKKKMRILEIYETPGLDHSYEQDDLFYRLGSYHFKGRKYPPMRRKDYSISTIRLMWRAFRTDWRLAKWIMKRFMAFWYKQALICFSVPCEAPPR